MEKDPNSEIKQQTKKPKINTTPIRVLKSTAKTITSQIQKLNKKPHGRKVRVDDLLVKALSLLENKHLEEIKKATLSNADKLEINYREYCKENGQISKDEYLGRLLSGQNSPLSGSSDTHQS